MRKERFIAHVDMDAFFAAIEARDNPAYLGKPVVIGADPKGGRGRGVVSTCSYEARRFGIRSAMPISAAYRSCPHAAFLPPDMEKYASVSSEIYEIFYSFTPDIEPVGIDEAFLDITSTHHLFGTPFEACLKLKSKIRERTRLTASIGLAPTKMAAKIASDLRKPDGMVEVREGEIADFLRPLDVRKIWGIGEITQKQLNDMGIATIGELAGYDAQQLVKVFGKAGEHLHSLANGLDDSPVCADGEAKSISNETTFDQDTSDRNKIDSAMMELCEQVSGRLRQERVKARTITLKVRLEGFLTYTRAITLAEATSLTDTLYKEAKALYNGFAHGSKKVRLVGVKASNLAVSGFQLSLFGQKAEKKYEAIDDAVDRIKAKFGSGSIQRATTKLK